ncbi:DMT family transporter [Martelella mediterranea]|uniref:Putative membrane protein n=1 Tax=Martelella mediterranea TaxID=293089 RepID=A0A4R3NWM8_9HYPH|nr:DMT family transporter [Martelella mediterranea]TCT43067.1 putative membrane protein [Martelella mediterranea]
MELWILITFASAFLQNMRSGLQKYLKGRMATLGATFTRFGFGLPFAALYLAILVFGLGREIPSPNEAFAIWALIGAFSQIGATFLLVYLFSFRNFAVGTAYSRTEPAQAAIIAFLFFGAQISFVAIVAIVISVSGVMLISLSRNAAGVRPFLGGLASRTAAIGIGSGTLFALSAVAYRAASLSLAGSLERPDSVMQAAFTLLVVITVQTVSMGVWMLVFNRDELTNVFKAWKPALAVGFVGATASFGWFTAMTLQQAALVKAVAQVEMLLSLATSAIIFRERITKPELAGCSLIVIGVLVLLVS